MSNVSTYPQARPRFLHIIKSYKNPIWSKCARILFAKMSTSPPLLSITICHVACYIIVVQASPTYSYTSTHARSHMYWCTILSSKVMISVHPKIYKHLKCLLSSLPCTIYVRVNVHFRMCPYPYPKSDLVPDFYWDSARLKDWANKAGALRWGKCPSVFNIMTVLLPPRWFFM